MDEKSQERPLIGRLVVSSSPHLFSEENIPRIMHAVILALVPAMAVGVYFFGIRALWLYLICVASSVATEYIFQKARKKPTKVHDGSAIITGLLLAMCLPPTFPLYMVSLGSIFAIAIGKQIFGGLGYNIFNPALLGRAFLQAAFPVQITNYVEPFAKGVDVVTSATPLALMKFEGKATPYLNLFLGNVGGSIGETSAIAIIIGGLYLRYRGYINWKLPLGYLSSIAFFGAIFWYLDPSKYPDPLFHILSGGAMLAAFFMVTDMVTCPVTPIGQWIFVIVAGLLTVLIRLLSGLQEGVMYSILIANAITPLLNTYTRPRYFGEVEAVEK